MSTILKALRKLEEDKTAPGSPGPMPVDSGSRSSSPGSNRWSRRRRLLKSLLMAAAGCLIVVVSIYFYLYSRDPGRQSSTMAGADSAAPSQGQGPVAGIDERQPRSQSAETTGAGQAAAPPSRSPSESASVDDRRNERPPPAPMVADASPQTGGSPSPAPADPAGRRTQEYQSAGEAELPGAQAAPAGGGTAPDTQDRTSAAASTPSMQSPRIGGSIIAHTDAPRLTDGRLKVHAIAWSAIPEKCLAVINASIVHEGDTVDGFVVLAIEPEAVIVREKEGTVWRLAMGRK